MSNHDSRGNASSGADSRQTDLGAMLRHARELRELSIEDLARCLRLEPRIIRHLENDQFEQLPGLVFIRGYVRSIAKELDVDSAPLLAVLDLRFESVMPPLADFQSRASVEISSDSSIIRYTTIGLVIIMLVLVVLWWRTNRGDTPGLDKTIAPADRLSETSGAQPLDYEFTIINHPEDPFYHPAPDPPKAVALTDRAMTAAPAQASKAVIITTRGDSWIEVRDATGKRLYYDLARPGSELRLRGLPPYSLIIGNTPVVAVRYNDKVIKLDRYSQNGIARFELGAAPAPPQDDN